MQRHQRLKGMPRRRKGIILLMTLFFMVLFYMLAFGIYTQSQRGSGNGETRTSFRDKTITEASFACGAGIRLAKEWVGAVTKPGTTGGPNVEDLGSNWADGSTTVIGSHSFFHAADDVFSVPADDPNFQLRALAGLACPKGRFAGKTGVDFLGFKADSNLTGVDYTGMKANEASWPVFVSKTGLQMGSYQVYTYLVPSTKAIFSNSGMSGDTLKSFLCVSIAYRDGLPVLRSRVLLKEISSAKFAYRSNKNGQVGGRPVSWVVSDANSVLFDGPVHTNDVPVMSVPESYWDAALTYFNGDTTYKRPKRAFMGGGLTFSSSNTLGLTQTPAFDGVGYSGGNILGVDSDTRRPYNASGAPIASSAQGIRPDPELGPIRNRYDRLIEGGREAIRKIPSVPLPSELLPLKAGAFGKDSVTGLDTTDPDPAKWGVDATQKNGVLQATVVTRPGFMTSTGAMQAPTTRDNSQTKEVGIFVNPVAGGTAAAGGVVIKGDTRNMYLEVTDANGRLVTSNLSNAITPAPTNSANNLGNPTIRIQSTIDSYDSNTGNPIPAYTMVVNGGTWQDTIPGKYIPGSGGTWQDTIPGKYNPTVPGTLQGTVPGKWNPEVPGKWQAEIPGKWQAEIPGKWQAEIPGKWIPPVPAKWVEPTGSGSAGGYTVPGTPGKWDPATVPGKWNPATTPGKWNPATTPGKWNPATVPGKWDPVTINAGVRGTINASWNPRTVNGRTVGASTGKWDPPTVNGRTVGASTTFTTAGVDPVLDPMAYKAQDWVVDVKNVAMTIPTSMPLPTGTRADQWQTGYGANMNPGASNSMQAGLLGKVPNTYRDLNPDGSLATPTQGVKEVFYHPSGDAAGTKLTSPMNVPKGKIAVFKQSRSDANRVDVFILDNPAGASSNKAGLSGAVYGTGNISGLRGINMDAKTIGVDFSTEKKISIADNITQVATAPGAKTTNGYHGLGIVATAINVQTRETSFTGLNNRLYVYATMIAGKSTGSGNGGMDVSSSRNLLNDTQADFSLDANSTDTNATGRDLFVYGGLTEQETKARLVGSAGGSKGWNQIFNFDKQLSFMPPPFFPSTNLLAPLSYFQEVVIGQ